MAEDLVDSFHQKGKMGAKSAAVKFGLYLMTPHIEVTIHDFYIMKLVWLRRETHECRVIFFFVSNDCCIW